MATPTTTFLYVATMVDISGEKRRESLTACFGVVRSNSPGPQSSYLTVDVRPEGANKQIVDLIEMTWLHGDIFNGSFSLVYLTSIGAKTMFISQSVAR